jgi:hypothetical protein
MAKSGLDLDATFQLLQLQFNALNRAFDATDKPAQMKAILVEMREFALRLDLIQGMRMDKLSKKLAASASADLRAASAQLTKSLKDLSDVNGFLKSASVMPRS